MEAPSVDDLPFEAICDLLGRLDRLLQQYGEAGSRMSRLTFYTRRKRMTEDWCQQHRPAIVKNSNSLRATLALLLPDLQRDSVYYMKEYYLSSTLAKVIGIGKDGAKRLSNWRSTDGDLGAAFEKIVESRVRYSYLKLILDLVYR
jgi:DNA ligase N terminus